MMRKATLDEILARVHEHDRPDLTWLCAGQDELLILEEEGEISAVVGLHLNGMDVSRGNMWLNKSSEEAALDALIGYAQEHYAGRMLHVSAARDESLAYEVLRYYDFIVDEVVTELDDDENEVEYIVCSKQL